jgi:hypothetical protein
MTLRQEVARLNAEVLRLRKLAQFPTPEERQTKALRLLADILCDDYSAEGDQRMFKAIADGKEYLKLFNQPP